MRVRKRLWVVAMFLAWALALVPSVAVAQGEPVSDDPYEDAIALGWEDGPYLVDVTMQGGSGKASVSSPAEVTVQDGQAVARIEWSSPNYDYMVVAGKAYLPVNTDGNSVFVIPLLAMDGPFDVIGDTTAMSKPHEVAYQLTFDGAGAVKAGEAEAGTPALPLPVMIACLSAIIGAVVVASRRKATR